MKFFTFLLKLTCFALISSFLSCSKKTIPKPSFGFYANGVPYQWTEFGVCGICETGIIKRDQGYVFKGYVLSAVKDFYHNVSLQIKSSTISVNTYSFTLTDTLRDNSDNILEVSQDVNQKVFIGKCIKIGDFVTIIISNIHDGDYADGTFSAQMTLQPWQSTSEKMYITKGEFHNLLIRN